MLGCAHVVETPDRHGMRGAAHVLGFLFSLLLDVHHRLDESDEYLRKLSSDWGRLMNDARQQIDAPDFMGASGRPPATR